MVNFNSIPRPVNSLIYSNLSEIEILNFGFTSRSSWKSVQAYEPIWKELFHQLPRPLELRHHLERRGTWRQHYLANSLFYQVRIAVRRLVADENQVSKTVIGSVNLFTTTAQLLDALHAGKRACITRQGLSESIITQILKTCDSNKEAIVKQAVIYFKGYVNLIQEEDRAFHQGFTAFKNHTLAETAVNMRSQVEAQLNTYSLQHTSWFATQSRMNGWSQEIIESTLKSKSISCVFNRTHQQNRMRAHLSCLSHGAKTINLVVAGGLSLSIAGLAINYLNSRSSERSMMRLTNGVLGVVQIAFGVYTNQLSNEAGGDLLISTGSCFVLQGMFPRQIKKASVILVGSVQVVGTVAAHALHSAATFIGRRLLSLTRGLIGRYVD